MTAALAVTRSPGRAHHRLTQAIGYAYGVLDAVTSQLLCGPTPCHAWDLRMLLEHAEESLGTLYEGVTASRVAAGPALTPGPASGACSAAALVSAFRQRATALLDASARADGDVQVTIGDHAMQLDCLRTVGALEIAVHAWDISQACGQRLPIPDEPATDLLTHALVLVPRVGRHPLFAPSAPVSPRSTSSDRLTAYLGRPRPPQGSGLASAHLASSQPSAAPIGTAGSPGSEA